MGKDCWGLFTFSPRLLCKEIQIVCMYFFYAEKAKARLALIHRGSQFQLFIKTDILPLQAGYQQQGQQSVLLM